MGMGRTHEEVREELLRDPFVYIEYKDPELVKWYNAERARILKRIEERKKEEEEYGHMENSEIIERVNRWQQNPRVHPLTCGKDSRHALLQPKEIDGKVVLVCKECGYVQWHIPSIVLEYVDPEFFDRMAIEV